MQWIGRSAAAFGQFSVAGMLAVALAAGAQAPNASGMAPANPPQKPAAHHKSSHVKAPDPEPVVEVRPPDPPPPDWPVNAKALPASVDWNGRDLSIRAANSSLEQILHDISTATGLKVDGMSGDQRIYGNFGPAPAREVLSSLMEGTGFNVLLIGDKGEGTPRQLVLTAKTRSSGAQPGGMQANMNGGDDEGAEEPEQPEQPQPVMRRPNIVPPPGPGRTPEQFLQEMKQRHEQLQPDAQQQQQNQQQLQNPPGQQPPPQ